MVPDVRVSMLNAHPVRSEGDYVLYWMIAARRTSWNFALDRACDYANTLGKPLVVLEALRVDYPWACDRFHQFVIDGMREHALTFRAAGVRYFPYLERASGEGRGLLTALSAQAAVVVTDEFPSFFLPRMVRAAGARASVRFEAVDSNGILPLRAVEAIYPTAYAFRRALQAALPSHLQAQPSRRPLDGLTVRAQPTLPAPLAARWPEANDSLGERADLRAFPIDHDVAPTKAKGGDLAGRAALQLFVDHNLKAYGVERNHPDTDASSHLSAYLHWGHVSAHQVFDAVTAREGWLALLPAKATGAREGWWGLSRSAESFLDELITWRELGYNMSAKREDYDSFTSLPSWAQATLAKHARDVREWSYALEVFEGADTHDALWNAAQRQLMREGRIHNYLRMLWGKKILEWSATPEEALAIMIHLNNKYALDGRDPNSYSGIFWTLGRYDRPWFPERPIYGVIRYMSSENTAKKLRVREYVRRFSR